MTRSVIRSRRMMVVAARSQASRVHGARIALRIMREGARHPTVADIPVSEIKRVSRETARSRVPALTLHQVAGTST